MAIKILMRFCLILCLLVQSLALASRVELGVDVYFQENQVEELKGKRIGLITNHTGVNSFAQSTIDLFLQRAPDITLTALFAPEHGLDGLAYAFEEVEDKKGPPGVPVYSLHGKTRRPTPQMLQKVDVLVYDIQDIGCRSYTYTTTLFYVMEEAAKKGIPVIILDRPNPISGVTVDGPMLEESWRSFIGYLNVPYCHGMTIGELANYFNAKYHIGCQLKVIPMKGWKRSMVYSDTALTWTPTSPQIPESDTPLFYATTGIIGELGVVNIGIGYTLPFKLIGAPWINAQKLAATLNTQKLPGVHFMPFHYRPFYGAYKGENCHGVLIVINNPKVYRPVSTQYMILGILKNLYPKQMLAKIQAIQQEKKNLFCKANGNAHMFSLLCEEKYIAWKMILYQKEEREQFLKERNKYFLYQN